MDKIKNTLSNSLNLIKYDILFWVITLSLLVKQLVFIKLCVCNYYSWKYIFSNFILNPEILIYLSYTIILTSICFLFSKRARVWYLILLDLIISLLIIWGFLKFRMSTSYFSVLISYGTLPLNVLKDILSYFRAKDLILLFDILILCPFFLFFNGAYKTCKKSICSFLIMIMFCSGYLGFVYFKVDIKEHTKCGQHLYYNDWTDVNRNYSLGIIGHDLVKWFGYVKDSYHLEPKETEEINDVFKEKHHNDIEEKNQYFGMFQSKNIIFLQLESFEPFVLNQKVNGQELTPNLNKIMNNSIYFPNIYPNNNFGVSSDCDFLINTGLYPSRVGQTFYDFPRNQYPNALPKLLKSYGYYTASYHCDNGYSWNAYENLIKFGFDEINESSDFVKKEQIGMGVVDHEFLPQVAEKVSKLPTPFFATAVTVSGHSPFSIPDEHKELNLPSDLNNTLMGDFFQTTRYTDKAIGDFIENLNKLNLLDNTVLFIYGDHGGIHKYHKDKIKEMSCSEPWWFGPEQIPLIVYNKNLNAEINNTFGGQIDFYPTLSYLLGIDNDFLQYTLGKNLFNTDKNYVNVNGIIYGDSNEDIQNNEDHILKINQLILKGNYLENKVAKPRSN
ncbi:uncharacterized sulfatase [Clostridium frigidicarnis]|uniref:Uncharacterized sulfatase n=1 Tax=Clostridium frigidicarnis TaxID=84698 RepID=A0A1I0VUN0_9CLOT|nr:uncharacterized sulfatase [Clostridium frigidicarnis]